MANFDANTPQLKAAKTWASAYISLDTSNVEKVLSKSFQIHTFPKTGDTPEEGKGTHIQRIGGILASLTKFESTFHEVIEAPGKVVLHISTVYTMISGATFDYDTLCILSLVEEDGELKILECKSFTDPQKRRELLARTGLSS